MAIDPFRQARALDLFSSLVKLAQEPYFALERVRDVMLTLVAEYRGSVDPSRLLLYPKLDPESGRPRALYWGEPLSALKDGPLGPHGERLKRIKHLRGCLTPSVIAVLTSDYRLRALYLDFCRRRTALNNAHAILSKRIADSRKILSRAYRSLAQPESLSFLPSLASIPEFPPQAKHLVLRGLHLIDAVIVESVELRSRRDRFAEAPVEGGPTLFWDDDEEHPNGRYRWSFPVLGFLPLSDRLLRQLRMSRPKRELLHAWEGDCSQIVSRRAEHLDRLSRIRNKITSALREADEWMAQAALRGDSESAPWPVDDPSEGIQASANEPTDEIL